MNLWEATHWRPKRSSTCRQKKAHRATLVAKVLPCEMWKSDWLLQLAKDWNCLLKMQRKEKKSKRSLTGNHPCKGFIMVWGFLLVEIDQGTRETWVLIVGWFFPRQVHLPFNKLIDFVLCYFSHLFWYLKGDASLGCKSTICKFVLPYWSNLITQLGNRKSNFASTSQYLCSRRPSVYQFATKVNHLQMDS